jgi:hypothetical protein
VKNDKRTNNDLQNTTLTTKDRATGTPLSHWELLRFSGRVTSSCCASDTSHVTLSTNPAWGRLAIIDLTTLASIWGTRGVSATARVHRITPDFLVWGFAARFCFYSLRNICVTNAHGYVPLVGVTGNYSGSPEGSPVPAALVTPVMLL